MTQAQRDAAKQRLEVLELRLDGISAITDNGCPIEMGNILQPIINETVAEIVSLEKTLATKLEFLFNFKGGGWNSEIAYTKEDAIEQAVFKYGHPDTQEILKVDVTTFRVSTPDDRRNLLSFFD
jgi:hypothetical protein